MVKGFLALFQFKNGREELTLFSVEEFTQWSGIIEQEDLRIVILWLTVKTEMTKEEGTLLVSEVKRLVNDSTFKKISEAFHIFLSYEKDYNKETAVELDQELNNCIKRGIKFNEFSLGYDIIFGYEDDFMMTKEEVEALVEGIGPEHKETLPRLFLRIKSSVEVNLLDHCRKLEWPANVKIYSIDLKHADFDLEEVKRLVTGSKFNITLRMDGDANNPALLRIVEAGLCVDGLIRVGGLGVTKQLLLVVLSPAFERRKVSKDQIITLNIVSFEQIRLHLGLDLVEIEETNVSLCDSKIKSWLSILSEMYSSGERRILEIESLKISDSTTPEEKQEELITAVQELLVCISEQDHSLLKVSAQVGEIKIEIPQKLQKQIEVNLPKKMSQWIQSGTEVVYGRLKLMLIGQGRAGKSSTIRSLLNQPFDKNLQSTLVAEAGNDVSINVQDVSSKWKETNLKKNWVAEEMGEYLNKVEKHIETKVNVFSDPESSSVSEVEEAVKNQLPTKEIFTHPIIESKFDDEDLDKTVRNELNRNRNKINGNNEDEKYNARLTLWDFGGQQKKLRINIKVEKDNARLTIWDFGGQHVFYALHHLYLTRGGIYILVFDMTLMLKQMEEELRVINFWLNSVELHAPQAAVIMVGTRSKKVKKKNIKTIDIELKNLIETKQVNHLEAEKLSFFPIDNSYKRHVQKQLQPLRALILDQGKQEKEEGEANLNLWQKRIPLNWIYFMNHLINKFDGCITANQLFDIGKEMNLDKEKQIIPMLEFYQNAGAIIPFMKASPNNEQSISDYIVLSPEWLLKVLGSFVYDPNLHKRKKTLNNKKNMGSLIANYEKTGILSKSLLLFILSEANVQEKNYQFILDLCQEMLIMSRFDFEPKWITIPNDTFYLVPTMNKRVMNENMIQQDAAVDDCVNIYLHSEKAIPIGLFERVICVMLTCNRDFDGTTLKPIIATNFAMFCFRDTEVFLIDEHKTGDFRISLRKHNDSDLNIIVNLLEIGSMIQEKLKCDVLGKQIDSSIQIKSLDENGKRFRCSVEHLLTAVSNDKPTVPMIDSNGDERLKNISQLKSFGEAAKLIVERKKQEKEKNKLKWEYDVFLAHTWGPNNVTHEQVVRIDRLLKERNFKTWLDEANLKYYISNDIVDGLKKSSCILVFITELYLEKVENADTNASREFAQAVKRGIKYLVPVVLDENCLDPRSWLGSTVGYNFTDALYFDFSSEEKIKANIGKLCERIDEMSQVERPQTP